MCACVLCARVYIHVCVHTHTHTHIHIFSFVISVLGVGIGRSDRWPAAGMATPTLEGNAPAIPHHLQPSMPSSTTDYVPTGDNEGKRAHVQIATIRACPSEALPLQKTFYWGHY